MLIASFEVYFVFYKGLYVFLCEEEPCKNLKVDW